jgi:hypothetical protein
MPMSTGRAKLLKLLAAALATPVRPASRKKAMKRSFKRPSWWR